MGGDSHPIRVSGGAGGLTARFEDMLSYADVLDTAGDDLRATSGDLGRMLLDQDLAEALVLCPGEVAEAEAKLALAATGPDGALWTSGELEATARLVRFSVDTYREVDQRLSELADLGWDVAGFGLGYGMTVPLVAAAVPVAGGHLLLDQVNPELADRLTGATLEEVQETIYENPWLEEALTRLAPGLVQGGAFSLASLLGPQGQALLVAASGGEWPTTDYHDALSGLVNLGGLFGLLQDQGRYTVAEAGAPTPLIRLDAEHLVGTIFEQQGVLSAQSGELAHVQVIELDGDPPSYIVQIPGTQTPALAHGQNPLDMDSNTNLMQRNGASPSPLIAQEVLEAMSRAGIPADAPVMLTGHSQGGIIAAQIASDDMAQSRFTITSIVTGGSPIARFPIPDDVSVLSLEHDQDIIAKLDGSDNPDEPNWVTVQRHLTGAEGAVGGTSSPSLAGAHSTANYSATGALIDSSTDETIDRWRRENAEFLSGDGTGTAQQYVISPQDAGR